MANNFRILVHRNPNSVHLKLTGDFDGSSAMELVEVLKGAGFGASRIFIHTNGLRKIYPFGRNVFEKNAGCLNTHPMIFTGEKADRLAPEGSTLM